MRHTCDTHNSQIHTQIKDWGEVDRLGGLERLEDLLLVGNPLYNEYRDTNATPEYRVEVRGCGILLDALQQVAGSGGRPL